MGQAKYIGESSVCVTGMYDSPDKTPVTVNLGFTPTAVLILKEGATWTNSEPRAAGIILPGLVGDDAGYNSPGGSAVIQNGFIAKGSLVGYGRFFYIAFK